MTAYTEVEALAQKAVADPSSIETNEVLRLGTFITDRAAHVRAHHQAIALQREMDQPGGGSPLVKRMIPPEPVKQVGLQQQDADPAPVAEHPADTTEE